MANIGRLTKEFLVCGLTGFNGGFYEGVPVFDPPLSSANQAIADLVYAAHIEDDETYFHLDQRTDPACLAIYNAVTPEKWDSYRNVQAKYIRYEHRNRIRAGVDLDNEKCNDLMIRWLRTGEPADKTAWINAMQAIKNALPMPSGQSE